MEQFQQIAVIGAAGKMGSGISLLLLQQLAVDSVLTLIDTSQEGLNGLKKYLRDQLLKYAEKNISALRQAVINNERLVSNKEIIDHFMTNTMDRVRFGRSLEEAKDSKLIFEAISEDIDTKVRILSLLEKQSSTKPFFFSNTSSIPISLLNERASLEGRIIGFHFYNPPAVQKLIEIIPMDKGDSELTKIADQLALRLNKDIIYSKDIAGFIGNGYFIREINFACTLAEKESVYTINKVTQEFLLRPMGIFQLIDYVGLEVVSKIGDIMHHYLGLPKNYEKLFKPLLENGIYGGQHSNGSQKNGFFQYSNNEITGIYSPESKTYISLPETSIGTPPHQLSWKSLSKATDQKTQLKEYFKALSEEKSLGAELAKQFLTHLHNIIEGLVKDGVAKSKDDVEAVLKKGFYQLYGNV